MLRRLLLAVLVACLALPALAGPAACAPAPVAMAAKHHGHHEAPAMTDHSGQHACIGCAAPVAGIGRIDVAPPPLGMAPVGRLAVLLMREGSGPDSPPPRA